MGVYLVDHPPRHQQFRCPRRERPSGVIGVHTAESFPDETGPDTGAENVARFIRDRTNYGSYHLLVDSDSIIQLIEFRCVAYHIATHGLNEHTIGVSAATQAHRWGGLDDFWVRACVTNMARASAMAARWLADGYGITVPARRITLTQARNKIPGFIAHADADLDRRTDPGTSFPWEMYLDTYARLMAGEEDDVELTDRVSLAASDGERYWAGKIMNSDDISVNGALGYAAASLWHQHESDKLSATRQAQVLSDLAAIKAAVGGQVDEAALAQQIGALLIPVITAEFDGIPLEQIEAANERAIRSVLGTLDA